MNNSIGENINCLVDKIIDDYKQGSHVDIKETFMRPKKDTIVKIIVQLRNIIFPEYFKNSNYRVYTIRNNLAMQLEDVMYNLSKQISIVLKYLPEHEDKSDDELLTEAEQLTLKFLDRLTEIRRLINTDLEAAYDGDPAAFNKPEIVFSYPGLFAILVSRIAHELYLLNVPLIPRIMTEYAHTQTGIDIHPGATIGEYFFIDHGTGIVVGETSVIGNNVKIYQGVTIGALSTREGQKLHGTRRHPTTEDNVTIYAGASILGGNTVIGRNSVIGSNVFITTSIPPDTRVSIKTQELLMKSGSRKRMSSEELVQDDKWCYEI